MLKEISDILWYNLPISSETKLIEFLSLSNKIWFNKYLLEKDFYLTIILHRISREIPEINFKWWTCLNKIYFPYFRLSEDLDFCISIENSTVNSDKKREIFAKEIRDKIKTIKNKLWWSIDDDIKHHAKAKWIKTLKNKRHTYLKYILSYASIYDKSNQTIKIEITFSNHQYLPSTQRPIQSIYTDPITEEPIFLEQNIQCLNIQEMICEKVRACMTRRNPAIRDFFDLRYLESQWIDIFSNKEIIKDKCDEVSDRNRTFLDNYNKLEKQIQTDLIPVLKNIWTFKLKDIYDQILSLYKELF